MIKFFRKIRLRLLTNNNFSRYLLYAIGEIILVVIGILIALQINNWNENRKNAVTETNYLMNIRRDLSDQIALIDEQIEFEQSYVASARQIIKQYDINSSFVADTTLFQGLANLISRRTFVVNDASFTDLISSGNIGLISSDNIRNEIINYYGKLERVDRIIQNNNTFTINGDFSTVVKRLVYYYPSLSDPVYQRYFNNNSFYEEGIPYHTDLASTSIALLSEPANELSLFNQIRERLTIGLAHLTLMENIRSDTELLISKLQPM